MADYTKEYVDGIVLSFDGRVYSFLLPEEEVAILKYDTVHERCRFPDHLTTEGHLKTGCSVHLCIIDRNDRRSILPDHRYYLTTTPPSRDASAERTVRMLHVDAMRTIVNRKPKCKRYLLFMDALDAVLGASKDWDGTVQISFPPGGWVSLSYEGKLKQEDYSVVLASQPMQSLLEEMDDVNVEIEYNGHLFRFQSRLHGQETSLEKENLQNTGNGVASIKIAYLFNGERYHCSTLYIRTILEQYKTDYPRVTFLSTY